MTRFTVLWDAEVESRFIDLWLASDSHTRTILTDIANWVDDNLAVHPDKQGQERSDLSLRIVSVPVSSARVSVVYHVLHEDRQVRVVRIVVSK